MPETAIIIGAGPAGLTAAYELLTHTNIKPIVLEKSEYLGGISRTVNYKGNRIDIGGHRFFSKSDKVMQWWLDVLPLQTTDQVLPAISYQQQTTSVSTDKVVDPKQQDNVMLIRKRKSRIYFLRQFFDYPIRLNFATLYKLGLWRSLRIGLSYLKTVMFPLRPEHNLEQFFINRFGKELYLTFFKAYTEKVWGTPCEEISAEWGAQRIKGLSVTKALKHFFSSLWPKFRRDLAQKNVETSLIEQFLYPKYGPGQLWEEVGRRILDMGGQIVTNCEVQKIYANDKTVTVVEAVNRQNMEKNNFSGEYFLSTMPIKELLQALQLKIPDSVKSIGEGLMYRDFITVGLLLEKLKICNEQKLLEDNWIYIQEPDVQVGRLQIFNNWSPYMVADDKNIWLGLEYFCYESDEIWNKSNKELMEFAVEELHKIDIIDKEDVIDGTVIRMPKTYPAYFGSYNLFPELREYLDQFANLFLIGRNGMHKYNNQDHSMLTAMESVNNIREGRESKENIWALNTEAEYHEAKK